MKSFNIWTNITWIFVSFISIAFLYLLYVFVYLFLIKPYFRVKHFKKLGGIGHFSYGPQFFLEMMDNAAKTGNSLTPYHELLKQNPDAKFIVRNLGSQALIILTDLELIKDFLQNQQDFDKSLMFKDLLHLLDKSILMATGEEWKSGRKLAAPAFYFDTLKNSVPMILNIGKKTFDTWIKKGDFHNNAIRMFSEISGEVAMTHLFGKRLEALHSKTGKCITPLIAEFLSSWVVANSSITRVLFGPGFVEKGILASHKKFLKLREECLDLSKALLAEARRTGLVENSYFWVLNEQTKIPGSGYNDDRLGAELLVMIMGGTDTSAHTLGFLIFHLFKHPQVYQKLLAEIDREVPNIDNIDLETINRLTYTNAVVKETMRLTTPSPLVNFRDIINPHSFGNFTVEKGDLVCILMPMLHHNEKYFSNPLEFIPERWLPDGPFQNDAWKKEPYSYIPFSFGPRICIAQHLANISIKLILVLFVKTFKFKFPEDYQLRVFLSSFLEPLEPLMVTLDPISK